MISIKIGMRPIKNFGETEYIQFIVKWRNLLLDIKKIIVRFPGIIADDVGRRGHVLNSDTLYLTDNFLDIARELRKLRSQRDEIFKETKLFNDPAWNILLNLFISREICIPTSTKRACIDSGVPQTTALRWLKELEVEGLLIRDVEKQDELRKLVCLSPKGTALMIAYFRCYEYAKHMDRNPADVTP